MAKPTRRSGTEPEQSLEGWRALQCGASALLCPGTPPANGRGCSVGAMVPGGTSGGGKLPAAAKAASANPHLHAQRLCTPPEMQVVGLTFRPPRTHVGQLAAQCILGASSCLFHGTRHKQLAMHWQNNPNVILPRNLVAGLRSACAVVRRRRHPQHVGHNK